MAKVLVKVTGTRLSRVWIDGGKVTLGDGGAGEKNVSAGEYHAIQYLVRGDRGTKFSVAITSPDSVTGEHSGKFDENEIDMGGWWFNVPK